MLPEWIGRLVNLKELFITDNQLKSLPKTMQQLKNLYLIDLSGNPGLGEQSRFYGREFEAVDSFGDDVADLFQSL